MQGEALGQGDSREGEESERGEVDSLKECASAGGLKQDAKINEGGLGR